jgi:CBS domain-containing protein
MFEREIGHLPVIRDGRLVGIVTRSDYLAWMRESRRRKTALLDELGVTKK